MKYILIKDNLNVSIHENSIIMRRGLWNSLSIEFEKDDIEKEGLRFEILRNIVCRLLNGEEIEENEICFNSYLKYIFNNLLLLKVVQFNFEGKLHNGKTIYIYEDNFESKMKDVFEQPYTCSLSEIDALISNTILDKYDFIDVERCWSQTHEFFKPYECIVVIVSQPYLRILNKINRVAKYFNIPLYLAFQDNMFLTVACFETEHGGCFECFELQAAVRVNNYSDYNTFKKEFNKYKINQTSLSNYIFLHSLIQTICQINQSNKGAHIGGKVFSIYLPTLEFNVDTIYRIPTCNCCGQVSVETTVDYNVSTRKIIEEVLLSESLSI